MAACGSDDDSSSSTDPVGSVDSIVDAVDSIAEDVDTTEPSGTVDESGEVTVPATDATEPADDMYAFTGEEPPGDGPEPEPGLDVWIVSCGEAASGCATATAAAKAAGEEIGWNMTIVDGNFNVADGYGNAIRQAIAAGVDAIGLHGVDCALVTAPLREAQAAGIPVVTTGSFDCDDPKNETPGEPLFTSEVLMNTEYPKYADWFQARGEAAGNYIVEMSGGQAQLIDIHFVGQLLGEYQHDGIVSAIEACAGCAILADVPLSNADLASGADKEKVAAAAVQNPDANAISYAFSSMWVTAQLQSVVAQMGGDVLVVGGEGQIANLDAIRTGADGIDAEVAYSIEWQSYGAIDTINRILHGQDAVTQGLGWAIVDADHNSGEVGDEFDPPIDFRAAYRESWGI